MKEQKMVQQVSGLNSVVLFVALAVLLLAGVNLAYAFGGPGSDQRMQMRADRVAEKLDLSDAQRDQFKQIHEQGRSEGKVLHEAMRKNRDAMHQLDPSAKNYAAEVARLANEKAELVKQMVVHKSEVRAEVYAMLTPEQREQMQQLRKEHWKKGFGDSPRGEGKGRCNNR